MTNWYDDPEDPLAVEHKAWLKEKEAAEKPKLPMTAPVQAQPDTKLMQEIGACVGAEIAKLDARIAELEQTTTRHEGVWNERKIYRPNALVTHAGGMWLARSNSHGSRPGNGPNWKLVVKSK